MDTAIHIESVLVASVLGLVLLWLALLIRRRRRRRAVVVATALFSAAIAWTALSLRVAPLSEEDIPLRPIAVPDDGYVSSQTCRSCHPREYTTWHDSYHRTMTQLATPETVLGDFDGTRIEWQGTTYRLGREDDVFFIEFDAAGPEGATRRVRRPILMTTGSHHVQLYWYPTGENRNLELFPWVYLLSEKRWMPRKSIFVLPPEMRQPYRGQPAAEPGEGAAEGERWPDSQRWNHTCIHCHTTRGQPMFSELDTRAAEFGIACESCHGPAEEHIRSNQDPQRRYRLYLGGQRDDTIVDPSRLSHRRGSQVCGICHGFSYPRGEQELYRDLSVGRSFEPGDEITDTRIVVQPSQGLESLRGLPEYQAGVREQSFWADGMIRVKGREYNGLIDSPCYQTEEFSCFSCHTMHPAADDPRPRLEWANDQLKPGMDGNLACLQCHAEFAAADRLSAHSRHPPESSGSQCYNCHMPYTTFGLLKAIRSHQVDSPSVAVSLETGRPNACNQCHLDKTLAWGAEHLENWYGIAPPELSEVERAVPASLLWMLAGDAAQRGLITWSMGWDAARETSGTHWMTPFLAQLLIDPYDAVRFEAIRSLRRQPGFEDFEYDFVGPPDERQAAAKRAAALGRTLSAPAGQVADAMSLIDDPGGIVPGDIFARLLTRRNDRMVALAE